MLIEKVTRYRTSDGILWIDEEIAVSHESYLILKKEYYADPLYTRDINGIEVECDQLVNYIKTHKELIHKMLKF